MKTIICPFCGGDKIVYLQHLPDVYVNVTCPTCEGEGAIEAEEADDLPNCVWRHAATPFARNH